MRPIHIADRTGLRHITPGKTGTSWSRAAGADPDAPVTGRPGRDTHPEACPVPFPKGIPPVTARTRDRTAACALQQFVGLGSREPLRSGRFFRRFRRWEFARVGRIRSRRGAQRPRTLRTGHPAGSAEPRQARHIGPMKARCAAHLTLLPRRVRVRPWSRHRRDPPPCAFVHPRTTSNTNPDGWGRPAPGR